MIQETPAVTAQRDFSQLLSKVQYQHEQFIITEAGKPVAALIDMVLFEAILQSVIKQSNKIESQFAEKKIAQLHAWLATLPDAPDVPLEAMNREQLY